MLSCIALRYTEENETHPEMVEFEIWHPSMIQPTTLDLIDIFVVSVGSE